jgi:hypothetical protein
MVLQNRMSRPRRCPWRRPGSAEAFLNFYNCGRIHEGSVRPTRQRRLAELLVNLLVNNILFSHSYR